MDRRAQPDPVQFVFCGNTTVQVQGKRKESVTLCFAFFPLNLLACLVEVSRVSTADRIVMKIISDLPLRKVSSRQLNLPGKLVGAPHGLVRGRG